VIPIYDLQHRLQPEFPEVSANGEWEWREYLFRNAIRRATLLLADSEVGKQDILDLYGRYGVTPDRIKVLPYATNYAADGDMRGERVRVRKKYQLPSRYLFYPAQFWPHKNHARIVEALSVLRASGPEVHVVLCGSHIGAIREETFRAVMELADRLGVRGQVCHLDYVPNEDIPPLYREATGLIMPTFFGPANIPIVEAWALGCPVLTSDVRGIREQAGDAALLIDPRSVESLAFGMQQLWEDEALRCRLIARGSQRTVEYSVEDFRQRLAEVIREASQRVAEGNAARCAFAGG
jgi:glycosyltransferase involved in cell wall biosynthesis